MITSTPVAALLRNLFVLEILLVSIRARDLSSGNIATVRPANPAASIASLRVKSPGVDVEAVCAHSGAESSVEAASAASKTNRDLIGVGLCTVCAAGLDSSLSAHEQSHGDKSDHSLRPIYRE